MSLPGSRGQPSARDATSAQDPSGVYRKEALDHRLRRHRREGEPLRISPSWTRWVYWLLIGLFAAGLLFAVFGRLHQYAEGPAVVHLEGRAELTALAAGTVTVVEVQPAQAVGAGDVLARFYDAQEGADLERIRREFELQLVNYLKNSTDVNTRQALITLRTQKEFAEARLEERIVRAPRAGVVSDIHVRPGQHVATGETLLSLLSEEPRISVIAMLPGHYRPLLRPGMSLRLELSGYRYAYQRLTIGSIGDEVIGPQAARRYLGQEIADTITLPGPVVVVRAHLQETTFLSEGRPYKFHDGMQGKAEVRVRSESILLTLIPGLKALFGAEGE